ncbi:winged helix-turn-helix domain-containing protein [Streptomyces sp. NBC_01613]
MIAVRFQIDCSMAAVWRLLHRHGWSWQSPARRALERWPTRTTGWPSSGLMVATPAASSSTAWPRSRPSWRSSSAATTRRGSWWCPSGGSSSASSPT